ncbi:MAG: hypothetical protein ACI90V_013597 [Bacillariaceae sp.]|jgi:hypothetical protein
MLYLNHTKRYQHRRFYFLRLLQPNTINAATTTRVVTFAASIQDEAIL